MQIERVSRTDKKKTHGIIGSGIYDKFIRLYHVLIYLKISCFYK